MKWETWNLLTRKEKEEYDFKFSTSVGMSLLYFFEMVAVFIAVFVLLFNINKTPIEPETIIFFVKLIAGLMVLSFILLCFEGYQEEKWLDERLTTKRK